MEKFKDCVYETKGNVSIAETLYFLKFGKWFNYPHFFPQEVIPSNDSPVADTTSSSS